MAKPVAEDTEFIHARLAEIEAERAAARNRVCESCKGIGWTMITGAWTTCPACENPAGKIKP